MTSQVAFTVDSELKQKTMQLAKEKGIPLKSFLVYCMKSFVNGKIDMGIQSVEDDRDVQYTPENHKARLEARKDLEEGKNIYSIEDLEKKYR